MRRNLKSVVAKPIMYLFSTACYLILLFPNATINGLLRQEVLIGDPFYLSRMRAAKDSLFEFGSIYLPVGSLNDGQTELLSLGEMTIGVIGNLLNLSTSDMYIYSSLLVGLLILKLFLKIFQLFDWQNFTCFIFTIICIFLFWGPSKPFNLERPISPQIVLLVWLLFLLVALKNLTNYSMHTSVLVGLVASIALYIHYPFLYLQILTGLIFLLLNRIRKGLEIRHLLVSISIALIFSLPNVIYSYHHSGSAHTKDLLFRSGLVDSHLPAAGRTIVMGTIIIFLLQFVKKRSKAIDVPHSLDAYDFIMAQAVGCMAISNSNLITGKSIEFSNHFDVFIYVLLIVSTGVFLKNIEAERLQYFIKLKRIDFSLRILVVGALTFTTLASVSAIPEVTQPSIKNQQVWKWISDNLSGNSGVLFESDAEVASTIVNQRLFYSRDMFGSNFLQSEVNKRYFANYGCTENDFTDDDLTYISGVRKEILIHKINRYLRVAEFLGLDHLVSANLLDQKFRELDSLELLKSRAKSDFAEVRIAGCINFLKSRGVNYIFSPKDGNWSRYNNDLELKLILALKEVNIYKIV